MVQVGSRRTMARNTLFNLAGVGLPTLAALLATPALLKLMGPQLFGILSLQLGLLVLITVNDFGVSRAILLVAIDKGGFSNAATRETAVRAGVELMLILATALLLVGAIVLAAISVMGTSVSLGSWAVVVLAGAVSLPTLPLRARLEIQERFGLLNLIRGGASSLLFLGPLVAVLVEPTLMATAIGHLISRTLVLLAFLATAGRPLVRGLPGATADVAIRLATGTGLPTHRELIKRGGWLGAAGIVSTLIGYVDRMALGLIASATAVSAYAVSAELATKIWLVIGALIAAATPRIAALARSAQPAFRIQFQRLAIVVAGSAMCAHAMFLFAGTPLLVLWLGRAFQPEMPAILMILSVGITVNCISQLNYLMLVVNGGERAAAQLQFVIMPLTFSASVLAAHLGGAIWVAWVFSIRLIVDAFIVSKLAANTSQPGLEGISSAKLGLALLCVLATYGTAILL